MQFEIVTARVTGPGNARLGTAKDFVVFLRWGVTVVQSGNDGVVRERKISFATGLNRYIVAQKGSETVEVAFFVGHGDQPPVAVSLGNFSYKKRLGLLRRAAPRRGYG